MTAIVPVPDLLRTLRTLPCLLATLLVVAWATAATTARAGAEGTAAVEEVDETSADAGEDTDADAGDSADDAADAEMADDPESMMTPSEAKLAAFDTSVTPAYQFNKPLWVYFEGKGAKARRGKYGWLWGMSPGYFFIETAGPRGKTETPSGDFKSYSYEQLNGVLAESLFKFDPKKHSWKNVSTPTVASFSFRRQYDVETPYNDLKDAAAEERKQLVAVQAEPESAATVAAAPSAAPAAPSAPAAPAQQPVAAAGAVDQIKGMPDMYKWAIGIGAVLLILFFIRR